MSSAWNKASMVYNESNLAEIMSEELSKRLFIENDFVRIDAPAAAMVNTKISTAEVDKLPTNGNGELNLLSCDRDITNIAQSEIDWKSCEENAEDLYYGGKYGDFIELNEEFDYWDQLENTTDLAKQKYPVPQSLKRKDHRNESSTEKRNDWSQIYRSGSVRDRLPKIKFNDTTTAILERLINNRYLWQYDRVVGTGKNSIVFLAYCHRRVCTMMPFYNAVKVYKTGTDLQKNKILFKRVQREFEHLTIVHKNRDKKNCKEYSPWPIRAWENVIVMSFVGFSGTVAPSIQDLDSDKHDFVYYEIVEFMDKCYNRMHLVHGKLSPKNILYWFESPWFIGWSHSVKTDHPLALYKLIKDCQFVTEFYKNRNVAVMSIEDLFKKITGHETISGKLLETINTKDLYDRYETNPNRKSRSPVKMNRNFRFK